MPEKARVDWTMNYVYTRLGSLVSNSNKTLNFGVGSIPIIFLFMVRLCAKEVNFLYIVVVVLLLLVPGVKQSKFLVFKTYTKTWVWQQNSLKEKNS